MPQIPPARPGSPTSAATTTSAGRSATPTPGRSGSSGRAPAVPQRLLRGRFPGSFARGALFQENEATGDARISGRRPRCAASRRRWSGGTTRRWNSAIRRLVLLYSVAYAFGGIPLLYMGDELALRNDSGYLDDPELAPDNRWMHRPPMDWAAAARRSTRPRWRAGSSPAAAARARPAGRCRRCAAAASASARRRQRRRPRLAAAARRAAEPSSGWPTSAATPSPSWPTRSPASALRAGADQRRATRDPGRTGCCCPAWGSPGSPSPECHEAGGLPPGHACWCWAGRSVSEGGRLSWCTSGWT